MNADAADRPLQNPTGHAQLLAHLASPIFGGLIANLEPAPTTERLQHEAKHAIACAYYLLEYGEMSPRPGAPLPEAAKAEAPPSVETPVVIPPLGEHFSTPTS